MYDIYIYIYILGRPKPEWGGEVCRPKWRAEAPRTRRSSPRQSLGESQIRQSDTNPNQSTLDAAYVCVVPWSEFPIVPSYSHYPDRETLIPRWPTGGRNVQRFRGGLVVKAHRLCVSLNSRLESNKEEYSAPRCRRWPLSLSCLGQIQTETETDRERLGTETETETERPLSVRTRPPGSTTPQQRTGVPRS